MNASYSRGFVLSLVLVTLLCLLGPVLALAQSGISQLGITRVNTATDTSVSPPQVKVNLYLNVTDLDRSPLAGLKAADFALYENNVPIPDFTLAVVEHPLFIGIVIDSAVSFNTREGGAPRVEQAKDTARHLITPDYQRLTPDDEVAVFAFQDGQPVRLVDFTYDHQMVLDQGINQISTAGNQYTALFDILRQAIKEAATRPGAYRRVLLVFSDGVDRTSGVEVDRVIQEAVDAHLLIYAVGMGSNLAYDQPGSAFLRRLADETDGRYVWYRPGRAGEEEKMNAFLDTLVAQRAGYQISYASNQYQGSPEVHLVVQKAGAAAEDTITFEVPPLPPVVNMDNLSDGQVLVGTSTIQPSIARAQRDIERVEYYVDNELVYAAHAAPWTFEWDTQKYASSYTDAEPHALKIVACDIGGQCGEIGLTLGTRLPVPTPTPSPRPMPTPISSTREIIQTGAPIGALVIALLSLAILIIFIRSNKGQGASGVVAEVRRRTRVWRQRTGIFGGGVPATRQSRATLTVTSDMFKDKQFNLEERVIFLGREEERSDIVLYWDEYLSRRHAKIAQEGTQFYIWDMNSANGTWVNEQRVPRSLSEGVELSEAVPLHDGDIIRIGPDLRMRFNLASPAEQNSSPTAGESPQVEAPTQVLKLPASSASKSLAGGKDLVDTQVLPHDPTK